VTVPFVTMQAGDITAQVRAVTKEIDRVADHVIAAAGRALDELAEDMLGKAQAAAPVQTGRLQESGTTEPLATEGGALVKRWGFNLRYARMRDQGGTIVPVNAKMLAIPLSAAAKRLASPREQANLDLVPLNGRLFLVERAKGGTFKAKDLQRFHWMLVPKVTQQGNGYVTKVVEAERANVARKVAEDVGRALGGAA
jgi:hypothetical protein